MELSFSATQKEWGFWEKLTQMEKKPADNQKVFSWDYKCFQACLILQIVWALSMLPRKARSVETCSTTFCFDGPHCISWKQHSKLPVSDCFLFYHVHISSIDSTCVQAVQAQGCIWNRERSWRRNTRILYHPFPPHSLLEESYFTIPNS